MSGPIKPSNAAPIQPTLWFPGNASEAVTFYTSIFPNSSITNTTYYTSAGLEFHGQSAGSVLSIDFTLSSHPYAAINGPDIFKFTEAISLAITCEDQNEIDYYWGRLTEGTSEEAKMGMRCGWAKDRFGVSWQIVPRFMSDLVREGGEPARKVMQAAIGMGKLDLEDLKRAARDESA